LPLDRLGDLAQQVDEFHLGDVQRLDLDVGDDPALHPLQLLVLGISDLHSGLLLTGKRFDVPVEFGEHAGGFRILVDGFAGLLVAYDRRVLGREQAEFRGFIH